MRIRLVRSEDNTWPEIDVLGDSEGCAVVIFMVFVNHHLLTRKEKPYSNFVEGSGWYQSSVLFGQDTLKALLEVAAIYGFTIEVS